MAARVAKATGTALAVVELFDQFEMCLYHGHQHQLGQAFQMKRSLREYLLP